MSERTAGPASAGAPAPAREPTHEPAPEPTSAGAPEPARDALLPPTPGQTVGPFFGYALPYARGNELVEAGTPGAVRLHGTVYDGAGAPVPDALIEIWQADPAGAVVGRSGSLLRDGTFTGWGRAETDREGGYWFRTLTPGATEPGRAPFFAVTVFARGLQDRLHTRAYLPDAAALDGAALDAAAPDAAARNDEARNDEARNDEARNDEARNDEARNDEARRTPGSLAAEPLLASLEPGRRATLVTSREPDGSLRFDIRLQGGPDGEEETVFLTYDTAGTQDTAGTHDTAATYDVAARHDTARDTAARGSTAHERRGVDSGASSGASSGGALGTSGPGSRAVGLGGADA